MNFKGFTLLEVIAAIFILTVGAGAAFALIQQTLISTSLVEDKFTASYLIQEGMEIVKNLRDKAWLENKSWDEYLPVGDWQADYDDQALTSCSSPCDYNSSNLLFLKINGGFYNYDSGTPTKFKRKITISEKTEDKMKISIQVSWLERGKTYNLKALEYLTNWQK